jgi:hypothetical protein
LSIGLVELHRSVGARAREELNGVDGPLPFQSISVASDDERELPHVHGLFIYEREGKEAFLRISAEASVRPNPSSTFANQVTSSFDDSGGLREREQTALSLIGFSKMAREPLAQAILCISAVELLSTDTPRTPAQFALLVKLKEQPMYRRSCSR